MQARRVGAKAGSVPSYKDDMDAAVSLSAARSETQLLNEFRQPLRAIEADGVAVPVLRGSRFG